ncbi:MAG: aldehyde dehydrogenase family protein, partial [Gemmatimonadetes bacterium]|nr:aldehyde dehydrogenase family protein [Gemmatimonadota bacterium]
MTAPLHIAGAPRAGHGSAFERRNPSDVRDVVAAGHAASADDVAAAVDAAASAVPGWRRAPGRAALLHAWGDAIAARSEELAQLIAREVGKPIGEA